jgi:hypothetical protein
MELFGDSWRAATEFTFGTRVGRRNWAQTFDRKGVLDLLAVNSPPVLTAPSTGPLRSSDDPARSEYLSVRIIKFGSDLNHR